MHWSPHVSGRTAPIQTAQANAKQAAAALEQAKAAVERAKSQLKKSEAQRDRVKKAVTTPPTEAPADAKLIPSNASSDRDVVHANARPDEAPLPPISGTTAPAP